jgi:hypothetical protein
MPPPARLAQARLLLRGGAKAERVRNVLLRQMITRMENSETERKAMMRDSVDHCWPPPLLTAKTKLLRKT